MAGYIFIPYPSLEMSDFAADWQNGQKKKGKVPYQIITPRSRVSRSLQHLQTSDKLYILGHGKSLGSGFIGIPTGGRRESNGIRPSYPGSALQELAPTDVGGMLENAGLRKDFQDLRVFACGSGNTPPIYETNSFALNLYYSMKRRGYTSIRVTGYQGAVKTSYVNRQVPSGYSKATSSGFSAETRKGVQIQGEIFPAHTRRIVFSAANT